MFEQVVTFHDDLRLALSEERDRRHAAVRSLNATQKTRHGSGDSRTSGTVHVPVNSEVRQPPGGGSSKAEDAAYRLRFLWRQPQVSKVIIGYWDKSLIVTVLIVTVQLSCQKHSKMFEYCEKSILVTLLLFLNSVKISYYHCTCSLTLAQIDLPPQLSAEFQLLILFLNQQVKSPSPRHVCFGCNSAIEGRCVTALFKKFHPEHFVCSYCLAQLSQGQRSNLSNYQS